MEIIVKKTLIFLDCISTKFFYISLGQVISDNRIESATANHQKGKVVAQIIKGNIPVVNGVIHFISKPLVIINSNLYDVLAVSINALTLLKSQKKCFLHKNY